MHTLKALHVVASIFSSVLFAITSVKGQSENTSFTEACKVASKTFAYSRELHCCNEKWITRQVQLVDYEIEFDKCLHVLSQAVENQYDELPVLMWKSYLCVLKSQSAFPDNKLTYSSFVSVLTSKYDSNGETDLTEKIRNANLECPSADSETEDWKKAMKYAQCFYKNEKEICTDVSKTSDMPETVNSLLKNIPITCTPLDGSRVPFDNCCRKMALPVSYNHILKKGILNRKLSHSPSTIENAKNCVASFVKRQKELQGSHKINIISCRDACLHTPEPYTSVNSLKLDLNINQSIYFNGNLLTQNVTEEILETISNTKATGTSYFTNVGLPGSFVNKTFPFSNYAEEFAGATDELLKIQMYCVYYGTCTLHAELAFWRYCSDEKVAAVMSANFFKKYPM